LFGRPKAHGDRDAHQTPEIASGEVQSIEIFGLLLDRIKTAA
jgi:hypothetical protein